MRYDERIDSSSLEALRNKQRKGHIHLGLIQIYVSLNVTRQVLRL
jgi:hypothetical protein